MISITNLIWNETKIDWENLIKTRTWKYMIKLLKESKKKMRRFRNGRRIMWYL